MTMHDLEPAVTRLAALVAAIPDDRLGAPTPCSEYTVGDLLDHVGGMAFAFTAAAGKVPGEAAAMGPSGDASRLEVDWRTRIPKGLAALVDAWRDPAAWTGMTRAGGVDLPGEVAGTIALDELVIHGWDLARATDQPYESDTASLHAVYSFLSQFATPERRAGGGLFGPPISVPDDAPLLDRLLGFTGRDPAWRAMLA